MFFAIVALGVVAVWAAIVAQDGARGLTQAGIQTSGHLRALQAVSLLDTSLDRLEERRVPSQLEKVRTSQKVLDDSLDRMESGDVQEARQVAAQAKPQVRRLKPAVDEFLSPTRGKDSTDGNAEEEVEAIMAELQVLLNDLDADPSRLLTTNLESVTASERTVRVTAIVLIPLGLAGVGACGWLLSLYRRRAEATMRESLEATTHEARTDALTGLPNRRALLEELDLRSTAHQRFTIAIADLNGFKRYNDAFGHPAGDALLRRLGRKLAAACEGSGLAARLGGDEFCVLLDEGISAVEGKTLVSGALGEVGDGFHISASVGVVEVPSDAGDAEAALRLADARMYAAKAVTQPSVEQAMSEALLRVLDEHQPGLGTHVEEVAELATACAGELDLSSEEVQSVQRAAELHDIGKLAIPAAILSKPGALSDEEWDFMRQHSEVGERILRGIPSLERIASTVRSSHERWDGGGYPDGLVGDQIPVAARIIFVADAFCAMTEGRAYARPRSPESALEELRARAGTQFDPAVVMAFREVLGSRRSRPTPPAVILVG